MKISFFFLVPALSYYFFIYSEYDLVSQGIDVFHKCLELLWEFSLLYYILIYIPVFLCALSIFLLQEYSDFFFIKERLSADA